MPVQRLIHNIGQRRAWAIWATAMGVYVLAVFHRSSLGVAGLIAADRFGVTATELALFTVLQLLIYAAMQVPVGIALDRYGARRLLLCGLVVMTAAQLVFAFASSFPMAVIARAVLGAGDAMIFVSVLRLITMWFLVKQAPFVTQLTGQVGQLGAIVAAAPLSYALNAWGWTRSFALVSSIGVLLLVAVFMVVKDSPYAREGVARVKLLALTRSLRSVWGNPGTRLGLWSHFTSQFSGTVFAMLWGFPFLVRGQGWSEAEAGTLLVAMTGWVIFIGMVLGWLVGRFPFYRSVIVIVIVAVIALLWTMVLLRSTPAPVWLIVALAFAMATGGPAAMVGFDLARTYTPAEVSGRANGLINIGGFAASLLTMALIGMVLDHRHPGGGTRYDLGDFRAAFAVQYIFWTIGVVQILRYRRKAIAHLARVHPGAIESMKAGHPFVHPGFGDREGV